MKQLLLAASILAAIPGFALAAGKHSGGHGEAAMTIGEPGDAAKAKRTIKITMMEKEDGKMIFTPSSMTVRTGETVRLKFTNKGELDHEYVMDEEAAVLEHKALMAKFPEMEHADPNAIRLAPGKSGEIVWTFGKTGSFKFACLIPGHYESGMNGRLTVAQ